MNVCVFCGSGTGNDSVYSNATLSIGHQLAEAGHTLIYGGGKVGLMGVLADAVLSKGGKVVGVIPDFLLKREVGHTGLTELVVVHSMHERKKRMADLAELFIALPGGWGTLDELAEILTWRQLGLIHQPIGLLNLNHFFSPLISQMNTMAEKGFLNAANINFLTIEDSPQKLLTVLGVVRA